MIRIPRLQSERFDDPSRWVVLSLLIAALNVAPAAMAQDATSPDSDETESPGAGARDPSAPADAGADSNGADDDAKDEFPTVAIADYVLGCMAANGNTYEALQQCSCSIDFIKERMSYKDYEQANTVMQVQLDVGQRGVFYRDSNWAKERVEKLQSLQAESTLRCF